VREVINRSSNLPPEVKARATIEVDRLSRLSSASAEYGVTKDYLDWILALPWGRTTPESYEIPDVERIISTDYFGPTSIKEQILQRLSVRKLSGGLDEGPTLCLVGAPGTGKASLAKAIARSVGKEFIRISVGGISEVAEIKGTPRTFLGAQPGKIIRAMKDAGSSDPVILIEDIDYFNLENNSSVNMALLEVVDTRFNSGFMDSYLGVPFDLSRVLFICSVRAFEEIPEQFIPRFELMEIPGYIEREKIVITKKYIIPTLLKKHGLRRSEFKISEKILARIISEYTQEAGLLGFSQQIEKICRKMALEKAEGKRKSWTVNDKNLESFLGSPVFIPEKAEKAPEIGTATGLAWTGAGGDLMFIEGLKMKGEGTIITTGSLGEVMKESIQAAHSYVRSKSDMLGIDFSDFSEFDIHIHFPSGAIPKDGPSAGVTVCLVIASVMSERPIRNDVAMTGEVTLRGKVLPVGGVKEKISAAYRAGIYHIVLPTENKKDLKEIPKEIQRKTKFSYINRVDELFELCLMDFTPSSYTLEKIFAEEIEKAKKKKPAKKPAKKKKGTKAARPRKK
jgi:ATP-dependent Lon protease